MESCSARRGCERYFQVSRFLLLKFPNKSRKKKNSKSSFQAQKSNFKRNGPLTKKEEKVGWFEKTVEKEDQVFWGKNLLSFPRLPEALS